MEGNYQSAKFITIFESYLETTDSWFSGKKSHGFSLLNLGLEPPDITSSVPKVYFQSICIWMIFGFRYKISALFTLAPDLNILYIFQIDTKSYLR